jgi:L-lactate dehydrogenase complex protein LldG
MTGNSRAEILGALRAALGGGLPFPGVPAGVDADGQLPVTALEPDEDLAARFVAEVERVKGEVVRTQPVQAPAALLGLLQTRGIARAMLWDDAHLPIAGVSGLLDAHGILRLSGDNAVVETAQAGITGCDAAIAATGTLVLASGAGRSRMASLLPPLHIAIALESQLIPRLEDWIAAQYSSNVRALGAPSNITLITGCSRTADIEMSPVFGVHGPLAFVVLLIADRNTE